MKSFLFICTFLILSVSASAQCNLIATAMPLTPSCSYSCDGAIFYFYQNTGTPASPYIVSLQDSDGNILDVQTHMTEVTTIPYGNLCAGTYTILVQGMSCSFTTSATVVAPAPLALYINTTDPDPGISNGEAEFIVTGGTGPYQFSIDGGPYQSGNTFTGLDAGSYTGIVQDANGCSDTVNFDITMTDNNCSVVVTATALSTIQCYGACTGSIQYYYADANGNNPYSIELISGGTTLQTVTNNSPNGNGQFSNLCAGSYLIEVTDLQGCSGSYPIVLTQPAQLFITGVATTDATAGNSDGSATISATGGSPVYTYSLDGTTYQAGNTFTGLDAGVYIGYVKDIAGCVSIYTFVIQEDPGCLFNLTTTITDQPSCAWSCDGEISYMFSGTLTDPTFTIQLASNGNIIQGTTSPNQTVVGTFSNLCPGDYSVIVTNSSGCQEIVNLTLVQTPQLYANYTQVNPTIGNSDGSITVNASGGTAPYQYSMDGGTTWQASNIFSGLPAGFYIIHVEDANGCAYIVCIILTETSGCDFTAVTSAMPNTCYGACDGILFYSFNDPGNNPPYTVQMMQGTTVVQTATVMSNIGTGQFTGVCEGVYTTVVTDANGCTDSYTSTVNGPDYLIVTGANVTDASAGNSNGTAEILVTGGTAPYQFSIDNQATWTSSNYFTGLAAGVYILWVEDANGCSTIFCFVVNEDPGCSIVTTLFPGAQISCAGACDGVLSYAYSDVDNNPPYIVTLSNNGTVVSTTTQTANNFSGSFTNLCAGNYSIIVTNVNGCGSLASNYTLSQPSPIMIAANVSDASTGSANGVAVINATGGTGQYSYSLDNNNWQSSNVFDGLAAGAYIVYVADENGCSNLLTFAVGEDAGCNIVLTVFPTQMITCSGMCDGELSFAYDDQNAANGPYVVTLTNSLGGSQTQTFAGDNGSGAFGNLCPGLYTVTVQDINGCSTIQTFNLTSPTYLNTTLTTINATQGNSDGSATMIVTGGTPPYQFSIDNQATWQASNVLTGLGAGVYIVYVQDANGCTTIYCFVLDDTNVSSVHEVTEHISIYPNPTQSLVFVESSAVESVVVYSMNGQVIPAAVTVANNGLIIDLSACSDGVYVLEMKSYDGALERAQIVKK